MDVAIYVALPEELDYAIAEMEKSGAFVGGDPRPILARGQSRFSFKLHDFPSRQIEVNLIKGMGNIVCAAHVGTSFASKRGGPELALLVGISGSLRADVGLGDVVLSNCVKYYSPDKIEKLEDPHTRIDKGMREAHQANGAGAGPFKAPAGQKAVDDRDVVYGGNALRFLRDEAFHVDNDNMADRFVEAANEHKIKLPFPLRKGVLLGSNWVVDSDTYTQYLTHKNECTDFDFYMINKPAEYASRCRWGSGDLLAVDMESYGFLKAVSEFSRQTANVKAYAVRGISDLSSGKTALDEKGTHHRRDATINAVRTALLLSRFYFQGYVHLFKV